MRAIVTQGLCLLDARPLVGGKYTRDWPSDEGPLASALPERSCRLAGRAGVKGTIVLILALPCLVAYAQQFS